MLGYCVFQSGTGMQPSEEELSESLAKLYYSSTRHLSQWCHGPSLKYTPKSMDCQLYHSSTHQSQWCHGPSHNLILTDHLVICFLSLRN